MAEEVNPAGITISCSAAASMMGIAVAVIIFIASFWKDQPLTLSILLLYAFYVLAIIFFLFATEFFNLASWSKDFSHLSDTIGSVLYGLGLGWIILGLSMTFKVLVQSSFLALLTLALYLIGFVVYYVVRWRLTKEPYYKERIIARAFIFIQIFAGFFSLVYL